MGMSDNTRKVQDEQNTRARIVVLAHAISALGACHSEDISRVGTH